MEQARNKELSPRTIRLVETAKKLFFRYGIGRVSIEELCREAGVSKMTFYRYFPNKTAIAKYVLEGIYDEGRAKIMNIIKMDIPFEEKIQKAFITKLKYIEEFSEEFLKELMVKAEPVLKQYIEEQNLKSINQMREILQDAQKNGDIRPDIKVDFLIYMMNVLIEIFKDEKLQKLYPDIASLNKEVFNFFYYGVLKRKE